MKTSHWCLTSAWRLNAEHCIINLSWENAFLELLTKKRSQASTRAPKKKWAEKFFIYITKKIVQVIFSLQKLKPRVINQPELDRAFEKWSTTLRFEDHNYIKGHFTFYQFLHFKWWRITEKDNKHFTLYSSVPRSVSVGS